MYRFKEGDITITCGGCVRIILRARKGRYRFMELKSTYYSGMHISPGTISSQCCKLFDKSNNLKISGTMLLY